MYGCSLASGAEVPCIFYSYLNFYLKKREGEFLAAKNLYLIASWRSNEKVNFGPW